MYDVGGYDDEMSRGVRGDGVDDAVGFMGIVLV